MTAFSRRTFLELAVASAAPYALGGSRLAHADLCASDLASALTGVQRAPWHAARDLILSGPLGPAQWCQWVLPWQKCQSDELGAVGRGLTALLFATNARDLLSATAASGRGPGLLLSARYADGLAVTLATGPRLRLPETPIIRCKHGSIEPVDDAVRMVEEVPSALSTPSIRSMDCAPDRALLNAARLACATLDAAAQSLLS